MKLEVKYWPKSLTIDTDLDESIETALKPLGFERWASGFSIVDGSRDLAFERPNLPTDG